MHDHWHRSLTRFSGWTQEIIDQITRLWVTDGLTGTEIAEIIGASRGQVLGKLGRLGLLGNGLQPRSFKLRKSVKVAKPKKPKEPKKTKKHTFVFGALSQAAPDQEAEHRGSPFSHVPPPPLQSTIETSWQGIIGEVDRLRFRECRFPIGDPVEGYCRNHVASYRESYCPYHQALTHYVKKPKGEAA